MMWATFLISHALAQQQQQQQHTADNELSPFVMLLIFCVVMAISTFVLGSLPLFVRLSHIQMVLLQSLAAGLLLGAGITIVLPEGVSNLYIPVQPQPQPQPHAEKGSSKNNRHAYNPEHALGTSVLVGFLLMYFVDRIFSAKHRHFHPSSSAASSSRTDAHQHKPPSIPESSSSSSGGSSSGSLSDFSRASLTSLLGLVIHAFTDGIAMGATSLTSSSSLEHHDVHDAGAGAQSEEPDAASSLRLIVFLAIMLHKAPAALGLSTLLLSQGGSRLAILRAMAVFSLSTPAGALATYALGWWILENSPIATAAGAGAGAASAAGGPNAGGFVPPMLIRDEHAHALESGGGLSPRHIGMALTFSAGTFLYVAMHALGELMGGSIPSSASSSSSSSSSSLSTRKQQSNGFEAMHGHSDHEYEDEDAHEATEGYGVGDVEEGQRGNSSNSGSGSGSRTRRRRRISSKEAEEDEEEDEEAAATRRPLLAAEPPSPTALGTPSAAAGSRDPSSSSTSAATAELKPQASSPSSSSPSSSRRGPASSTATTLQPSPSSSASAASAAAEPASRQRRRASSSSSSPLVLEVSKTALLLLGAAVPRFLQSLTGGHGH
ncbi:hypothetical protein OC834_002617 [Tilletia horrida]|nr:hypothetical protein OC834_002617 [Tilletia horrida]